MCCMSLCVSVRLCHVCVGSWVGEWVGRRGWFVHGILSLESKDACTDEGRQEGDLKLHPYTHP